MSWDDYFAEDAAARQSAKRVITVGWTVRAAKSQVIWSAPKPWETTTWRAASAKSAQYCPAAVDFDRRHYVINCPVDLTLRFERRPDGSITMSDADGAQSAVRPTALQDMVVLHPRTEWRHPERPIVQIIAPYVFVADEPCFVVQTPPYLHYIPSGRPGVQICGRFPIHIWPRPLSWGFEWHDINQPLVLRRSDPWFYVHFETENPAARVRLVEQEMTEALAAYLNSIIDVSNYVNKTYSLFADAQGRRPPTLVKARKE